VSNTDFILLNNIVFCFKGR